MSYKIPKQFPKQTKQQNKKISEKFREIRKRAVAAQRKSGPATCVKKFRRSLLFSTFLFSVERKLLVFDLRFHANHKTLL